ncbi:MAG TPA: 4-amino-4-deoxychorismate lyase, partial [Nocardioidaceae bacterium]|nr:4-amino-4-deoxychorismate lyase [Nocardioidaceae bacterium]
ALLLEWYGAREVDEPIDVLRGADEIFLVSTTRDVQAVRRCDDRDLEAPGPLTREAMSVWKQREAEDPDP